MLMNRYPILFLFFLLPGCARVNIESEFSKLQQKTVQRTGFSIGSDQRLPDNRPNNPFLQRDTEEGLSRNEAVSRALQNNPGLHADFQTLGIAKADLVQAGFYTNPMINSVFRFPTADRGPGSAQTNIETVVAFRLSDVWQVPLSKKVAKDLLEIVTMRILSSILDVIAETKVAYDAYVTAQLRWYTTTLLVTATQELKDEMYYRQLYGYTTDHDKDQVDAQLARRMAELQERQVAVDSTSLRLKKLMGIEPSLDALDVNDPLHQSIELPSLAVLEEYAVHNWPELQTARMKVQQYKNSILLEKARVFQRVDIGIGYKQDFDKPFRGIGPYIDMQVPFFDDNSAQIARAEFLMYQAEKEFLQEENRMYEEIRTSYKAVQALNTEIDMYKNTILPSYSHAIDYAYTYASTMQLTIVTGIKTKIQYYKAYEQVLDKQFELSKEVARLERAVGKNLTLFR